MADALVLTIAAGLTFVAVLFAIEVWAIQSNRPTISERFQQLNRRMDKQIIAGLFFLAGAIAGWFIAHFTS